MSAEYLLDHILATGWSVMMAALPLAVVFIIFQVLLLKLPRRDFVSIVVGSIMASAGLFLFLLGMTIGFLPFGRAIGEALGSLSPKWLLIPFGFLLGFLTAWGEPAVRILADQVEKASNGSIHQSMVLYATCLGVAVWVGLAMLRIAYGVPLLYLLVPSYGYIMATMWFSKKEFVSIAIDAGGVATGPLSNTFLLSLALGLSFAMGDQDLLVHGLGMVALIAVAPVISITTLGVLVGLKARRKE